MRLGFLVLLCGLGMGVRLAWAQGTPDTVAVPAEEEFDPGQFLKAVKPTYTTTYAVARQTTGWQQALDFGSRIGLFSFDNKTSFDVRTDSGRDEERRDGRNGTSIRFLGIRTLPLTLSVNLARLSVVRPRDQRQTDEAGIALNATYNHTILGVRHTLTGGGGYEHRTDLSVQRDQRSESFDSGWNGRLDWRGVWSPIEPITVNMSLNGDRADKTSRLRLKGGAEETQPTTDQSRGLALNVDLDPARWIHGNVTYSRSIRDNAYFLVQSGTGAEERMESSTSALTGTLDLKLHRDFNLTGKVTANDHSLSYQVRRDIASAGDGVSWESMLKAKLLGTTINGTLSGSGERLNPATSADTDTRNRVFEGQAERILSGKITGSMSWLVRATQVFFSDPDPAFEIQDRDELRTKIQPGLTYRPSSRWTVNASYNRSTSRRIEINPSRASQTRKDEDYSVDFGINAQLTKSTRLSQSYSIKALYTTFDFNPGGDRLLATQRIVTNLTSSLTPRVNLLMEHRYTLQDSGPFRFEAGQRVFARSQRSWRQEMTADVGYRITPWLRTLTNTRFLRTDDITEGLNIRITRRTVELRLGLNLERTLGRGLRVTGTANHVRSSGQDPYWNLVSTVAKDF